MKIYTKILLAVLPMIIITGLGAFAITARLSRQALIKQTQNLLTVELNRAITITTIYNQLLEQVGLGDERANVRQAQLDALHELRELVIGQNGYILVVDTEGTIVAGRDDDQTGVQVDQEPWFRQLRTGGTDWRTIDFQGISYLAETRFFSDWGWYILAVEPEADVTRPFERALSLGILLILLVAVIILGLLALITKRILYPLQLVAEGAARIGQGDYQTQIPEISRDEVGQLAAVFNQAARHIRENVNALRESEKRFRRSIVEAPIPMLIHDEDGRSLNISKGWTKFSGYRLEDIPTLNDWTQQAYGENSGSANEYIEELFEINETVSNGEWIVNTKNGEERIWEFYTTPIGKISNGKRTLLSLAIDITERRWVEDRLRESETRLNTILEASPIAIGISRLRDGKIIYANAEFENLYGFTRQELLDHTTEELQIWAIPGHRQQFIDLLQAEGYVRNLESVARSKSGSKRYVIVTGKLVTIDEEPCLVAQVVDITSRKQAEETLRKSQELLRETASIGNVGGWELDRDTLDLTWTEQVYHIHEVDQDFQPTVETAIQFYAPDVRAVVEQAVADAIQFGKPYDLELPLITAKGNQRWVHAIGMLDAEQRRIQGFFQNITQRKQAEQQILQLTRLYATLSQVNQTIVRVNTQQELFDNICQVAVQFGKFNLAWIGLLEGESGEVNCVAKAGESARYTDHIRINLHDPQLSAGPTGQALQTGEVQFTDDIETNESMAPWRETARQYKFRSSAALPLRLNGRVIGALNLYSPEPCFFNSSEQQLLEEMGMDISFALENLESKAALEESEARFSTAFYTSPVPQAIFTQADNVILAVNDATCRLFGYSREELLNMSTAKLELWAEPDDRADAVQELSSTGHLQAREATIRTRSGEHRTIIVSIEPISWLGIPCLMSSIFDLTERKQAEKALLESEEKFRKAFMTSPDAININRMEDGLYVAINQGFTQITGFTEADVLGKTSLELEIWDDPKDRQRLVKGLSEKGFVDNLEARYKKKDGTVIYGLMSASIIVLDNEPHILSVTRDITARKQTEEQIKQQLKRLNSLHVIDTAISSNLDQKNILDVILEQVAVELSVDACAVLLFNPETKMIEYAASRGFRSDAIRQTKLKANQGPAWQVVYKRQILHLPDFMANGGSVAEALHNEQEAFFDYYGAPLIFKGEIKGVMEIYHRAPIDPDLEWRSFLETLATQTAIAIENAQLFDSLQSTNFELSTAYDATIEGWSRAMDLRDRETEGHTQRVTELTVKLARATGIPQAELVHIRRGSLLHDMGKLGVPDDILYKPGPLTQEEWAIMRQHPQFAYDMLAHIRYLKPALEIPYCHHEWWNGSGYPRGLAGDAIPLSARVFAVVDVWDALTSERPYRSAWSEEKTLAYIKEHSGTQFDPTVVDVFLELIAGEGQV